MKYFLHDTNAFDDDKITMLYMKFGYEGVGLFYTILEKLGKQEKPVDTIVLKSQLKVGKRLERCWKFMEEIGIISSKNGQTFNEQLLKHSENYLINKEKNRKRIKEWREKQDDTKNVTRNETVTKQVRNKPKDTIIYNKEKDIKEREQIFKSEIKNKIGEFFNHIEFDKNEATKFFNYWSEPNKGKTKLRFEMQKTWVTKNRIVTWMGNKRKGY